MKIQILIFACFVDSILISIFLNYWSLYQMCSTSSSNSEDLLAGFLVSELHNVAAVAQPQVVSCKGRLERWAEE